MQAAELREMLRKLTKEELEELMGAVAEVLEEKEMEEAQKGAREQKVHYEVKMIPRGKKLCGPYLYARWYDEEGRHRSKYLGKVSMQ